MVSCGALPPIASSTCRERANCEAPEFELLPSFGRPHYTIRLEDDGQAGLTRLLDVFGPAQVNKHYWWEPPGRR
jgi:hypothetical protein